MRRLFNILMGMAVLLAAAGVVAAGDEFRGRTTGDAEVPPVMTDTTGKVRVEFNNGHIYEYDDVPEQVFDSLMSARSKGGYLNSQIKERFNYKRIR